VDELVAVAVPETTPVVELIVNPAGNPGAMLNTAESAVLEFAGASAVNAVPT
jgi:hypothetical protein